MTTDALKSTPLPHILEIGDAGRRAARAAVALTVGEVATLGVFFAVGEPWGTINDGLTIALAVSTVPIAIGLARRNPRSTSLVVGACLDVVGVGITSVFTSLLIARRMTFEGSLPYVLGGQALIGCWLFLAGAAAWSVPGARRRALFGMVGGSGLVLTVGGFAAGGMESPFAFVGFSAGLIGSLGFYTLLGRRPSRVIRMPGRPA